VVAGEPAHRAPVPLEQVLLLAPGHAGADPGALGGLLLPQPLVGLPAVGRGGDRLPPPLLDVPSLRGGTSLASRLYYLRRIRRGLRGTTLEHGISLPGCEHRGCLAR